MKSYPFHVKMGPFILDRPSDALSTTFKEPILEAKTDLHEILQSLNPTLSEEPIVFVTIPTKSLLQVMGYEPLGMFQEKEGTTLILHKEIAKGNGLEFGTEYRKITLNVHSSLESVGLTAIVSSTLAKAGISANIWAGFYHDHLFIRKEDAVTALEILRNLQKSMQALGNEKLKTMH